MLSPNQKKAVAGAWITGGTIYAFTTGLLTSDLVLSNLHNLVHNKVAQAGFFYMAGQWLNNMMVKKNFGRFQGEVLESINNFSASMKTSLDEVARALREDLSTKASRDEVQAGFKEVHGRIDRLETK